jgi:hypothetical protein
VRRALGTAVALLIAVGLVAVIARVVYPGDLVARIDPGRTIVFDALHVRDPFAAERPAGLAAIDDKFASHRVITLLHILPGAIFFLLAPFQFSARMRSAHIGWHRWTGRFLLPVGTVMVFAGLYFGLLMPIGGIPEAIGVGLFGGLFIVSLVNAYVAIRRRQVARHREWMIRAFATAIAISTVRVIGVPMDVALTVAGVRPPMAFAITIWIAWLLTLAIAEAWIRSGRSAPARRPAPLQAAG